MLKNRLTQRTYSKVMLTAHRFTAPEALEYGIVDEIAQGDGEATIKRALEHAEANKKHSVSGVLTMLKQRLYADAIVGLQTDESLGSPSEQNDARYEELKKAEAALSAKL